VETLKRWLRCLAEIVVGLGALATMLIWLNIKPADLKITMPHWGWLASALILFFADTTASACSLYRSLRKPRVVIKEVPKEVPVRRQVSAAELEQIEETGALKVLAEEADWLASTLKAIFQWIDANDKRLRPHLEHPLDEAFRRHVGMNWGESQDRLTSFQEAYGAHRSRVAKHCPRFKTELTKQEHATLRSLNDKEIGALLISHAGALRAEASRLLDVFQPLGDAIPAS
jgi:hypothetical protein